MLVNRIYFKYCKDEENGDFIETGYDVNREMSLTQAKQLKVYLGKMLKGKIPKKLKFRNDGLCWPPYIGYDKYEKIVYMCYQDEVWLSQKHMKKIYNWLKKYV